MFFLLVIVSFLCRPGTITNLKTKEKIQLNCPLKWNECYFELNLPLEDYQSVSKDLRDTVIFYPIGFDEIRIVKSNTTEFLVTK